MDAQRVYYHFLVVFNLFTGLHYVHAAAEWDTWDVMGWVQHSSVVIINVSSVQSHSAVSTGRPQARRSVRRYDACNQCLRCQWHHRRVSLPNSSRFLPEFFFRAVAYSECAKGWGPGGLGDEVLRSWRCFVTECLNFDVLEEKISKTAKNTIIKNYGRLKGGGQAQGPPKYATASGYATSPVPLPMHYTVLSRSRHYRERKYTLPSFLIYRVDQLKFNSYWQTWHYILTATYRAEHSFHLLLCCRLFPCHYLSTFQAISTLCSEKNIHSQFLSYLNEWCVDINKICSEYTQGTVDANNVEIRYSLRRMT